MMWSCGIRRSRSGIERSQMAKSSADLPAKTEQIFAAFLNALTVAFSLKPHNLQHSKQLEAQCVDLV